MVIDGVQRVLRNRKFCLQCSPFKMHNRSSIEPFSTQPKPNWKSYTAEQKEQVKKSLYKKAYARKLLLIQEKGGGCEACNYSKSIRALTFHHKEPSLKLFGLSLNNLWSKTLEEIKTEAEKCSLLCMNCHAELEELHSNTNCSDVMKEVKKSFNLIGGSVG